MDEAIVPLLQIKNAAIWPRFSLIAVKPAFKNLWLSILLLGISFMRNLIFIVAVVLSLQASAQGLEIGVNAGINFSVSGSLANISPDYSIKAVYNLCEKLQ